MKGKWDLFSCDQSISIQWLGQQNKDKKGKRVYKVQTARVNTGRQHRGAVSSSPAESVFHITLVPHFSSWPTGIPYGFLSSFLGDHCWCCSTVWSEQRVLCSVRRPEVVLPAGRACPSHTRQFEGAGQDRRKLGWKTWVYWRMAYHCSRDEVSEAGLTSEVRLILFQYLHRKRVEHAEHPRAAHGGVKRIQILLTEVSRHGHEIFQTC